MEFIDAELQAIARLPGAGAERPGAGEHRPLIRNRLDSVDKLTRIADQIERDRPPPRASRTALPKLRCVAPGSAAARLNPRNLRSFPASDSQ